jgi:EAL domain-containing protein (putative c-di-GMP-specific phosphodiesterase class I)
MPVTLLKIDQSFVRESQTSEDAATVVSAIIGLARAYHLKVIAEGVETTEQRDFLRSVDCDYFQGYFYSRPLPPETFEAFARQHAV